MVIQRLPSAVVSSLRTDVTVTTTAQCVIELVLNAIDAGSTSIAVRIDLKNFRIQVIDNGCGLNFSDINLVGTRYMTSKCHSMRDLQGNLKFYGFRGEAMSSIKDVCGTLTIVSRCKNTEDTYCKVFSEGVALKAGKSRHHRASWGSTITVGDFLYNRPVRRARIKPALDLEEVKSSLEAVALINPHVSFSLRNDVNNDLMMQTQRVSEIPSVFSTLYGNSIAKSLVPVKESMGPFCIEGYISNEAHLLKNLQFIYVNKRLLLKTKIHKLVNSIMSRSAILKSNNVSHAPISKEINHNVFLAFSPPKRDKHAIFVLNIICPLSEYDITLDPKKTLVEFCNWDCLLSCFERLLRKFIESQLGPSETEEEGFDCWPPRKVETVIDEINQLAREQALGGQNVQANKGSISTRDLPRAIHSLPANRHRVNLSEKSPTECFFSTASSELFSSSLESQEKGRGGNSGRFYNSALTEQPCPPLSNKEAYQEKSAPTLRNYEGCFTETPSIASAPPNPKTLEGQSNFLFKKPVISSVTKTKPVKGFLSEIVRFEEGFRKSAEWPLEKKPPWKSSPSSPINALASIKEIRRKKLLSNLNKFSFNTSSKKPLLYKHPCGADQVGKDFAEKGRENMYVRVPQGQIVGKGLSQQERNKIDSQPKVQNTSNPLMLVTQCAPSPSIYSDDMQSIVATMASSDVSESKSEASCPILTDSANANLAPMENLDSIVSNDANKLKVTENNQLQSFRGNFDQSLPSPTDLYQRNLDTSCSSGVETITNDHVEGCFQQILSVEDMLLTGYDSIQQLDSPLEANSNRFNSDSLSAFAKTNEKLMESPEISLSFGESNHRNSDNIFIDHRKPDEKGNMLKSLFDVFPPENRKQLSKTCKISSSDVIDVDGCGIQNNSMRCKTAKILKLVDYDSSPPSSQESFASDKDLLRNNSMSPMSSEKRKSEDSQGQNTKRFCDSFESPAEDGNISSHVTHPGFKVSSPAKCDFHLATSSEAESAHCSDRVKQQVTLDILPGFRMSSPAKCDFHLATSSEAESASYSVREKQKMTSEIPSTTFETFTTSNGNFFDTPQHECQSEQALPNSVSDSQSSDSLIVDKSEQMSSISVVNHHKDCENRAGFEDTTKTVWLERKDHSGKPFFIHKDSGMTTYLKPNNDESVQFKFSNRFSFLPKGMSPILNDKLTDEPSTSPSITLFHKEEDLSFIKWDKKQNNQTDFWPLVDQLLSEADEFSSNLAAESQVKNASVQELSKSDIKIYNVAFPYTFTKDIFHKLRVLGQLDNKFIVTIAAHNLNREVIVLFDQHAVHERIPYKQHDGSATWRSSSVEPSLPLPLSMIEVRILESYKKKMEQLGFCFTVSDSSSIEVQRVPTCLLLRENREVTGRGVSVLRQHLESLIREQVDSLLNTRGVGTDHPKIIQNVISSEACRGAVKFGHSLTIADCQAFLHNLSTCKLPFQCAHGRPALVPIADLSMLKEKLPRAKPNLKKLLEMRQIQHLPHVKF
ncbi:hypothetical protein FOCC_FOCC006858 [Frankliniella occidentalis]|nr:hypothetical protein FOCC_FOCC006858 [Frankliniella occidentalis]